VHQKQPPAKVATLTTDLVLSLETMDVFCALDCPQAANTASISKAMLSAPRAFLLKNDGFNIVMISS
jgi:hypothetical protein